MRKKVGLGKKKELNAELNLTPFIDLLSTCVCFLLITAVWIEIGTVEIKQSHGTEAKANQKISYDLDVVFHAKNSIRLSLKKNGKQIKSFSVKEESFDELVKGLNTTIANEVLKAVPVEYKIATATVTPRSNVNYGNMISALDVLRKNEITDIGLLTARGR